MIKFKRILVMIFMMTLCFCIKANVNAATLPALEITRFDYGVGDKCIDEDATYFTSSIGTKIRLHAIIAHGNDMALPDLPIGTYVDKDQLDDVTWTSSAPTVATVDEDGLVTGVAGGTTTITAKYTDPSSGEEKTATKTITIFNQTCDPRGISDYNYRIYFSTGLNNGYDVVIKKMVVGTDDNPLIGYTLPTPTKEGYTFGGWYAGRDFKEEDKINDLTDTDWDFNYLNNSTPCKSYLEIGTVYAKWVPASTPVQPDQPTQPDDSETVKVDDTALGSNLYIIAMAVLLLTFGSLMVIIALKDNKVKTQ